MKTRSIPFVGPEIRNALVRTARRRLAPADAEDAAQDALLEAALKRAEDPAAFAFGVLKNKLRRRRRKGLQVAEFELPGTERILATAENVARLDAALEQILTWGGWGGSTGVIVPSLSDLDVLRVLMEFRATLEAIDLLPFSRRHRRRLRTKFERVVAAVWKESRVTVDPSLGREPSSTIVDGACDSPEVQPQSKRIRTAPALLIMDGALDRAFTVIRRAAPKLSVAETLERAAKAVALAAERIQTDQDADALEG